MAKPKDISGQTFGRLVALRCTGKRLRGCFVWECECQCGNKVDVPVGSLTSGTTRSCGCLAIKHGVSIAGEETLEYGTYITWTAIKQRCLNPNSTGFKNYGGRGITICETWINDFSAFISDIGVKPSKFHSIGRIDNNKGYSPGNCRWETRAEQSRNRRTNIMVTIDGVTKCAMDWASTIGISHQGFLGRIKNGLKLDAPSSRAANKI